MGDQANGEQRASVCGCVCGCRREWCVWCVFVRLKYLCAFKVCLCLVCVRCVIVRGVR